MLTKDCEKLEPKTYETKVIPNTQNAYSIFNIVQIWQIDAQPPSYHIRILCAKS